MIFYRVNTTPPAIELTQADAKRSAKQQGVSWDQIDIPTDKRGLAEYIQSCWNDAQPIEFADVEEDKQPALVDALPTRHVSQLVAFDDEFENMPLARKLHYAALAMEDARHAL